MTEAPEKITRLQVVPEITESAGTTWIPRCMSQHVDFSEIRDGVSKLTPSNEELLRFAAENPPPAEWLNGTDNPFVSEDPET